MSYFPYIHVVPALRARMARTSTSH